MLIPPRGPGARRGRAPWIAALVLCALASSSAGADQTAALDRASHDPSWRVRLQAAYVLSRQQTPVAVPILVRLLVDEHEAVRGVAAGALGEIHGLSDAELGVTRAALDRATRDRNRVVAERAKGSLVKLAAMVAAARAGNLHIAIGGIGAKPKNVSLDMQRRLREFLVREFTKTPGLTLDGQPVTGFLIDSSITALSRRTTRDWVEISCEISVIVGRLPSRAVVMMTSGGATVQQPRTDFTNERAVALEADALEGAVKGAHENLLAYLRQQK